MIDREKQAELAEWLGTGSINFFGMPFSGKDSQAKRFSDRFGGVVLGGGDILRNSIIPPHVKELIDAGHLAPTEDYIKIVLPYLSQEEFSDKPLLLSAVGRWKGEETSVIAALESADHPLRLVVFLSLDKEIAHQRLQAEDLREHRGDRVDDDMIVLDHRISEFENKTLAVIEHYRELGYLIEVDATLSKDEVERKILGEMAVRAGVSL